MDTIFTNSKNSKTCNPHRLLLNFSDKINLIRSDKYVPLSNLGISIHGKIYKSHTKNLNLKYQLQQWNGKFELLDESYSVSDIQDYFKYIAKNMGQLFIIIQEWYTYIK